MATKLSAKDRAELEDSYATLTRAAAQCKRELEADDQATKAAAASSEGETVKSIAARDGTAAGILAARLSPRRGGPEK